MDQVKRVNYFQGMMLVDEDFRDEQNYHRQTRHNHNLELHTWGVVRGLEVNLKAGALDVTEGLAIDANGKEIWWKGGAATAAGKPDDGVYLVIEWNEEPSDDYLQLAGKYLRLIDTCKFSFKKAAEANDVVLAKISVQDSQIQERPDNSVRRTASSVRANGGDLEIRPVASNGSLRLMTGAPSTARLAIDAKGNVGIGTTAPLGPLSVGNSSVDGSDGYLVLGKKNGNYTRHCRIGFDSTSNFVIGDYGNDNNAGTWNPQFGINWEAPSNSLYIAGSGNVGIAKDLSVKGALSVLNGIQLNNKPLTLRADDKGPDVNHGICYYGIGDKEAVGDFALDGPVMYGFSGGTLGTKQGAKTKVALRWNDQGNVGIGTPDPKSKLDVQGAANIWSGARHAVPNNFMAPGSLTIGNINANFGGGTTGWNTNTAGLLLETMDNTEIAVHDSNKRVASLMYYEGGDVNRITIGRQMDPSWGAISTLALNGNVGIGTTTPGYKLDVYGPAGKHPGRVASPDGYLNFGPTNGGWCHFETDRPKFWFNTGISVNTGVIATYGEGDLSLQTWGATRLKITKPGSVGIGTETPTQAKLVVNGSVSNDHGNFRYVALDQVNTFRATEPYSIYASDRVGANQFNAFSDERIKNIQGRSNSATDLHTLLSIEITDYCYKDVIGKGNATHKKVIGQQVEKVFPQAVSKQTDVVPDIYQPASFVDGWMELTTDLKKGERVRLISDKTEGVYEVLEVAKDKFRTDFKPEGDKVFVFGREVNDFLNVDYDAIAMLNVSATQQVKKEKDEEVKALRTEMAELKAANDALMKRLQILESKMASTPSVFIAKNGSNSNGTH